MSTTVVHWACTAVDERIRSTAACESRSSDSSHAALPEEEETGYCCSRSTSTDIEEKSSASLKCNQICSMTISPNFISGRYSCSRALHGDSYVTVHEQCVHSPRALHWHSTHWLHTSCSKCITHPTQYLNIITGFRQSIGSYAYTIESAVQYYTIKSSYN